MKIKDEVSSSGCYHGYHMSCLPSAARTWISCQLCCDGRASLDRRFGRCWAPLLSSSAEPDLRPSTPVSPAAVLQTSPHSINPKHVKTKCRGLAVASQINITALIGDKLYLFLFNFFTFLVISAWRAELYILYKLLSCLHLSFHITKFH